MSEEEMGDYISDITGFCHFGFNYKRNKESISIYNIKWDTDGDESLLEMLPKEILIKGEDYEGA